MGYDFVIGMEDFAHDTVARAVTQIGGAGDAAAEFGNQILQYYDISGQVAQFGLLPVGLSLLILHEQYTAATNNAPFRVGYVFVRFLAIIGLLLEYDLVVRLLTSVGAGKWGNAEDFFGWVSETTPILMRHYQGVADLPNFLFWTVLFVVLLLSATLAYIVNTLLSISQGLLIVILLTVGKTCIAVSIVPGIGLGKSWARMLAMVASWSGIASIIVGMMKTRWGFGRYAIAGAFDLDLVTQALRCAAEYVILACFLGAVPWITSAIFNGVAAMAPGVAGPLGKAIAGGQMMWRQTASLGGAALSGAAGAISGRGEGGARGGEFAGGKTMRAGKVPRGPGLGGSSDYAKFGERQLSGKAAREYGKQAALGGTVVSPSRQADFAKASAVTNTTTKTNVAPNLPRPAAKIPTGNPGKERFESSPIFSSLWRSRQAAHADANSRDLRAPPKPSPALSRRIAENQGTLKAAYPDLAFNPKNPSPLERAVVSELDSRTGRFGGWEHGRQGTGDFAEARDLAEKRLDGALGAETYVAPKPAAAADSVLGHDGDRNYASGGTIPVGDVVLRNDDGSKPSPAADALVPSELHRAAAPEGVEGDRFGQVEYWSWQKASPDPGCNTQLQSDHAKWQASRDKEIPRATVEAQWQDHDRANAQARSRPEPAPVSQHVIAREPPSPSAARAQELAPETSPSKPGSSTPPRRT